jgi:hypothetical protein
MRRQIEALCAKESRLKRYKVIRFQFDGRAAVLNQKMSDDWETNVKDNWLENKRKIKRIRVKVLLFAFSCIFH